MRVRRALVVGAVASVSLVACGSSNKLSARANFEAALEKTLRSEAKSDKDRQVAECVISTTKGLSDADYAKIVLRDKPTPEVLDAYRAALVRCGAAPTIPVTAAP